MPDDWPDFDFTIHVHSYDDDPLRVTNAESSLFTQYHGDAAEWSKMVPVTSDIQMQHRDVGIPYRIGIDQVDQNGQLIVSKEEDSGGSGIKKKRRTMNGEETMATTTTSTPTATEQKMTIVAGDALVIDNKYDVNSMSSYFYGHHFENYRLQQRNSQKTEFEKLINPILSHNNSKGEERTKLFHFKFFNPDSNKDDALMYVWSGLIDIQWSPADLYHYVSLVAQRKNIVNNLKSKNIMLWDPWKPSSVSYINMTDPRLNVQLDTPTDTQEPGPALGQGDTIVFQLIPEALENHELSEIVEIEDWRGYSSEEKQFYTENLFKYFIENEMKSISVRFTPTQYETSQLPVEIRNNARLLIQMEDNEISDDNNEEQEEEEDDSTSRKRKRENGSITATSPISSGGNSSNVGSRTSSPSSNEEKMESRMLSLCCPEITLDDINIESPLSLIKAKLFEQLKCVDNINLIDLHEEEGTTRKDDNYNPNPIHYSTYNNTTLKEHISYDNENENENENENQMINKNYQQKPINYRDKNVRKIWYTIRHHPINQLVYHGGNKVEIQIVGKNSINGKIFPFLNRNTNKYFRCVIDQGSTMAMLGVEIKKWINNELNILKNDDSIQENDIAFQHLLQCTNYEVSNYRFYQCNGGNGGIIRRIFGLDEIISNSLMLRVPPVEQSCFQTTGHLNLYLDQNHQRKYEVNKPLIEDENGQPMLCVEFTDDDDIDVKAVDTSSTSSSTTTKSETSSQSVGPLPNPQLRLSTLKPPSATTAAALPSDQERILLDQKFKKITDANKAVLCNNKYVKYLVSIVNFSLTSDVYPKMDFHGDPILIEINILDTVESIRKTVQKRWNVSDGEMDNVRLAIISGNFNDTNQKTYLEAYRGDLSKRIGEGKGEAKDHSGNYPYNDDGNRWVFIDDVDSLLCFLLRKSSKAPYACVTPSDCQLSQHNVLTLGFEHLKRRGKTKNTGIYNRWASRELKIKK